MNILTKLSIKNLKMNKKRTIGTIIGIILSVALITAVAGMFESLRQTLIANAIEETGYYHYALSAIDGETLKTLKSNRQVANIMPIYELGVSEIQSQDDVHSLIYVRSTDYFDDFPYKLQSGRKPTNSNEIVIPTGLAENGGLKIGDPIELDVGKRETLDGYELDMSNPYHEENAEQIVDRVHKTYKIVGIYTGPGSQIYHTNYYNNEDSSAFYRVLTAKDTSNKMDAFVALVNPKKGDDFLQSLSAMEKFATGDVNGQNLYKVTPNTELLRWEANSFSDGTLTMLYTVVGIVIGIIVVTSVFCIRNSFAISTTEKQKTLGMLASIGATKKQIKKSVLSEALILGIIGIPLGILSGILADFILIKVVNSLLKDFLFNTKIGLIFTVSFAACLLAIILGGVTIFFSAISSARKASKVSPIDNMRSSKDIALTRKNMKTPKIIQSVFKTGGVLAYKNLKRSKKKYRTTVISLTVSVFVFISMNSFLTDAFKLTGTYYTDYGYNVTLGNVHDLTADELSEIRHMDDVEDVYTVYEVITNGDDYLNIYDLDKINDLGEESLLCEKYEEGSNKCLGKKYMSLLMLALDDATFQKYASDLGLDYTAVKTKSILVDEITVLENNKTSLRRLYKYKAGDTIDATFHDKDFQLKIAAVTDHKPYGIEGYNYYGGFVVVDKEAFPKIDFVPYTVAIESSNPERLTRNLKKFKSTMTVTDLESVQKSNKSMALVISIFLYGFITVIILIGVTNIFNTITSNMELRQKEFAMLKSIGMTKKEFSRMINLETFFYSTKSLMYGIVCGLIGAFALHNAFGIRLEYDFRIPWTAILISIVFVFFLVYIIMRFSITKINKQNTIETIRKENI